MGAYQTDILALSGCRPLAEPWQAGGIRPWLLALPIMSGLMLLLGYLYHIVLGGEAMAVDIAIFVAVMVFGFWFSTRFSGPFHGASGWCPFCSWWEWAS